MKTTTLILSTCITLFCLSSCASYMRSRATGDSKSGINIITSTDAPVVITLNNKENPLESKLVYDGSLYNSPYKVYKYYLPRMYKNASLKITADNKTRSVQITRQKDEGWFWIDGMVVWIYESVGGKYYYYNDVNISAIFEKDQNTLIQSK